MFGVMHPNRKYSPTQYLTGLSPITVSTENTAPNSRFHREREEGPKKMPPPQNVRKVMRAIKRRPSLEVPEVAGNQLHQEKGINPVERGGAAHRGRKKSYRPPDVRTIFESPEKDPRVPEERGEGHVFCREVSGAWCDLCCEYIFYNRLTCTGCKYTCHPQCRSRVSLDCHQTGPATQSQDHISNNNRNSSVDVEKEKELRTQLSREEISHKVALYNSAVRDHLKMTLNPSGLYTGFIKVQLELLRPITVRGGAGTTRTQAVNGEEAFYMPRGTVNTLHISSSNTVRQVIEALLHKFTVADNPAKFALFKRYRREEQVYVCKLAEEEHPLFLRLVAGPNTDCLSFVLREQQTGEVMWDAFSIPELQNFLRILNKEEDDQVLSVTRRYNSYREKLKEAMGAMGNHG